MPFVLWEILIPLIIAFLLGLLFGWLWWGWRRTKITYTEWETMRQKASRASSVEAEAELVELRADRDRLQAALDECEAASSDAALGTGVLGISGAAAAADSGSDDAGSDDAAADDAGSDDAAAEATAGEADAGSDDAGSDDAAAGEADAGSDDTDGGGDSDRPVEGERHPYGEGSHAPFSDDPKVQPEGYDIKGNADSMLYHRPDSRSYKATIAEVWFDTPERAEAAGFGLAGSHPKD